MRYLELEKKFTTEPDPVKTLGQDSLNTFTITVQCASVRAYRDNISL